MKKDEYVSVKCPLCNGKGKILSLYRSPHSYSYKQIKEARKLYRNGLSLRKIAQKMKIKHPQTIKNLIHRKII